MNKRGVIAQLNLYEIDALIAWKKISFQVSHELGSEGASERKSAAERASNAEKADE